MKHSRVVANSRYLLAILFVLSASTTVKADELFRPIAQLIQQADVVIVGKLDTVNSHTDKLGIQRTLGKIIIDKVTKGIVEAKQYITIELPPYYPAKMMKSTDPSVQIDQHGLWLLSMNKSGYYRLIRSDAFIADYQIKPQ